MLKELFPGSTDFTVAIFKIAGISKHFSAMLVLRKLNIIFLTDTYKFLHVLSFHITKFAFLKSSFELKAGTFA